MRTSKHFGRLTMLLTLAVACAATTSRAETILDTTPIDFSPGGESRGFTSKIWSAQEFSVGESFVVNSVEGFFFRSEQVLRGDGELKATIFVAEESGLPGEVLHEAKFSVPNTYPNDTPDWHGVGGQEWEISPGTYWVAMTTEDVSPFTEPSTFSGGWPFEASDGKSRRAVWLAPRVFEDGIDPAFWQLDRNEEKVGYRVLGKLVPEPTGITPVGMFCVALFVAKLR